MSVVTDLLEAPPEVRWAWIAEQPPTDREAIFSLTRAETGTPYGLFADDPVGFDRIVLRETLWDTQQRILASINDHQRTVVPSCFGAGKTHVAARAVIWWSCVHPVGTAITVTTATRFRQVKHLLWPHIGKAHARHKLPGSVDQTQWKMTDDTGREQIVAYGFSAPDYDEDAAQGIHAPHVLLVIDEGGGISSVIGDAFQSLLTGGHTRLLVIGNPPTDTEDSWMERLCDDPDANMIRMDAASTPNFTGEPAGVCRSCPPFVAEHSLAEHLIDQAWVTRASHEHGEDSNYVAAKVDARFPKGGSDKTIPYAWIEDAAVTDEERRSGTLIPEPDPSTWVRLGVDVASDGGDELAIALSIGNLVRIVHTSAGAANANSVDVAGKILEQIRAAELIRRELDDERPVRVKVDAIGLGWGPVSTLQAWASEGMHSAEIIGVDVSESPKKPDKYRNRRAEMWWEMRLELQPRGGMGSPYTPSGLRLDLDRRTLAQLAAPTYHTTSAGLTQIQPKAELKKKGRGSPDRAEAVLLARYEPVDPGPSVIGTPTKTRIPRVTRR